MLRSKNLPARSRPAGKFNNLPPDIIRLLLVCLDFCDIYSFFRMSKKYYRLSDDESFWKSYSITRELPVSLKDQALLDYLGHFKDNRLVIDDSGDTIEWLTSQSPSINSVDINRTEYRDFISERDLKEIFFRKEVTMQVPYRGRPEKLQKNAKRDKLDRRKKIFILKPNTSVGSTLKHVFNEIYKNMYNLKDDEISKDLETLGIQLSDKEKLEYGLIYDIVNDRENGYYKIKIR